MKQLFSILLALSACCVFAGEPKWINDHSSTDRAYYGFGVASTEESDYVQKAAQAALLDIAGQISIKIENSSFLQVMEVDNQVRDKWLQQTHSSLTNFLQGQQQEESYINKKTKTYYVLYSLDKDTYRKKIKAKTEEMAFAGYEYLKKGNEAVGQGNVIRALDLYAEGLTEIQPWLFLNLQYEAEDGTRMNIPVELFNAYASALDGMQIRVTPREVHAEALKAINEQITITLTKNSSLGTTPLINVPLTLKFVEGQGKITPSVRTDMQGKAVANLTGVTSKDKHQSILVSIDKTMKNDLPELYKHFTTSQTWPEAQINIVQESKAKTAYMNVKSNDIDGLDKQIKSLLATNHFDLTPEIDDANVFIEMKSTLDVGGTVQGELYDLNECLVSLSLVFYDAKTNKVLTQYEISQMRVLCNQKLSYEQTVSQCNRELMKRVRRELPQRLAVME